MKPKLRYKPRTQAAAAKHYKKVLSKGPEDGWMWGVGRHRGKLVIKEYSLIDGHVVYTKGGLRIFGPKDLSPLYRALFVPVAKSRKQMLQAVWEHFPQAEFDDWFWDFDEL